MKISNLHAQEILDSRGNPTVECMATLDDGSKGWAAVPSGASTGKYEAVELRDHDPKRFLGLGVLKAVKNVNEVIAKELIGMDAENQEEIDNKMIETDGTENKSNLGANAILSVSLSVTRAQANHEKKPLYQYLTKFNPDFKDTYIMPIPQMNVINGAKHADWSTDIQEFMILPVGATSFVEALRMCAEVYANLKRIVKAKGYAITVGDEGGFAPPNILNNEEPFQLLKSAVDDAGYTLGRDIGLGIDAAASSFFEDSRYRLRKEGKIFSTDELSGFYQSLVKKFPIISFEDIFDQDDWDGFKKFTAILGKNIQIVGDDLYVTNIRLLNKGITEKATNSILIKLNQIGTLTETIKTVLLAKKDGMNCILSHRSGETEDSFIADFAVAMGIGQIKTGAPARSEHNAKYNRLMAIERELGVKSIYSKFPVINI